MGLCSVQEPSSFLDYLPKAPDLERTDFEQSAEEAAARRRMSSREALDADDWRRQVCKMPY